MTVRVLLVDDVPAERKLVRIAIERSGRFTVVGEGNDGGEAIDLAANLFPDLVVMDLSMPGVDGLEALPRVKQVSPGSRVVILSGLSGADVADSALRQGADGYLEKGLHPSELVAHLTAYARPAGVDGRRTTGPDEEDVVDIGDDRALPMRTVTTTVDPRLLIERETLHGHLLDSVADSIILEDANGTVRAANPAARRLFAIEANELGKRRTIGPGWRVVDQHGRPLPPDGLPGRTALLTGRPQLGLVLGLERDGMPRRWLHINTVPLDDPTRGGKAEPYGLVSSFADVTALREAALPAVPADVGGALRQLTTALDELQRASGRKAQRELATAIAAGERLRRVLHEF
jgi:CheY-like chemotaxis protein